ncbi:hypothetical protein GQ600_890 [Phytophthora cactorum]|nr:hypothetical protein GQ600_890 [Phytophthora cactorum]
MHTIWMHKSAQYQGLCTTHGGSRACTHPGCTKTIRSAGRCFEHGGGKRCSQSDCTKQAQSNGQCSAHRNKERVTLALNSYLLRRNPQQSVQESTPGSLRFLFNFEQQQPSKVVANGGAHLLEHQWCLPAHTSIFAQPPSVQISMIHNPVSSECFH